MCQEDAKKFLLLLLPIPSLLQHSLRPMKCPTMITTELQSTSITKVNGCRKGGEGGYLWIGSFEGGISEGFPLFDSVSVRFARLIVILW